MKQTFLYEKDFAGRYCPVVYFGEFPKLAKEDAGRRYGGWLVTPAEMDTHGEPMFGRLQAKYPAPPVVVP